jgi:N-hydroxyarylamine O-acetyltransferase
MTHRLDLDAYCARIGFAGDRSPTLATLQALVLAHVQAIPFENLDVLLGRGIDLDVAAIERKLVHDRRGGYCFEQNTLLLAVLQALGYDATPLSARVRVQRPREFTPPRTHVFVLVVLDGERWLCDVGVGALSPTAPLRLDVETPQATPHEPRRLIRHGSWASGDRRSPDARVFHQAQLAGEWQDVCEFTLEPMPPIDREVANWFTSAHPQSHFKNRLMAARATATGRVTLLNRELTHRGPDGTGDTRLVRDEDDLLAVLAAEFGIVLPAGTRFPCPWIDWSAPA